MNAAIDLALGNLLNCVKAGKGQTWTPKRIDLAFGVPVGCGMKHAKRMCKRLKGLRRVTPGEAFKGWQTAGLDAHKKPLMWPWGACWLRDEACQENV